MSRERLSHVLILILLCLTTRLRFVRHTIARPEGLLSRQHVVEDGRRVGAENQTLQQLPSYWQVALDIAHT